MPEAPVDPMALTVRDASKVLGVSEDVIREHIAAGLPAADGLINLVQYAAWLNVRRTDGA